MLLPLFLINPIQLKILVRDTGHHSAVEHLPSMHEVLGSLPRISHTHTKILVRINFFIGILRNKQTKPERFKFYIQSLYLGIKKKNCCSEVSLNNENIRHFPNSYAFAWYAKINFGNDSIFH